jgi:hypothetical protein
MEKVLMTPFWDGISHRVNRLTVFFFNFIWWFARNTKNFNKKPHYLAVPIACGQDIYGVGYGKKYADRLSAYGRDTSCCC